MPPSTAGLTQDCGVGVDVISPGLTVSDQGSQALQRLDLVVGRRSLQDARATLTHTADTAGVYANPAETASSAPTPAECMLCAAQPRRPDCRIPAGQLTQTPDLVPPCADQATMQNSVQNSFPTSPAGVDGQVSPTRPHASSSRGVVVPAEIPPDVVTLPHEPHGPLVVLVDDRGSQLQCAFALRGFRVTNHYSNRLTSSAATDALVLHLRRCEPALLWICLTGTATDTGTGRDQRRCSERKKTHKLNF